MKNVYRFPGGVELVVSQERILEPQFIFTGNGVVENPVYADNPEVVRYRAGRRLFTINGEPVAEDVFRAELSRLTAESDDYRKAGAKC